MGGLKNRDLVNNKDEETNEDEEEQKPCQHIPHLAPLLLGFLLAVCICVYIVCK